MSVITSGKTFSNGEQLSADKLNLMLTGATFSTSAVDSTSTRVDSNGAIIVRDGGITTAKIADTAVTTAKIADGAVAFEKLDDVIDDDTMATASATTLATSESIKAYVDSAPNFTPSTYAGEESVTLPSGLIMKFGKATGTGDTTITYGTPFPNAVLSIVLTNIDSGSGGSAGESNPHVKTGYTTSQFQCYINTGADGGTFWQAIGY